MSHESAGKSDEYYTPKYIVDGLGCSFDMDVASPVDRSFCHIVAQEYITEDSLNKEWKGFVWMNPPYGNEKLKEAFVKKFVDHANGIALMPDRTNANWWQMMAEKCDAFLFTYDKIKFIRADGSIADSPSNGSTLFAIGEEATKALINAQNKDIGMVFRKL